MPLQDQRVVIMGGTSGIGLATARAAHERGAEVVVTGRDEQKLHSALGELGDSVAGEQVDATKRQELDAFFADLGRVDHLVLAVGEPGGAGPIAELDLAELRSGFDGKFWPQVESLQAALPLMQEHGSVTFIAAASAGSPLPGVAGFAAINGALEAMVPALAVELKPLRINAVSPGLVDTPFWHGLPEPERQEMFDRYAAATPVGRVATPEDVAEAVVSIIGNDFITGTVLPVDGGLTLSAA